jgi:CO/xanthine dehydrogenase Mo-binding subunit
VPLPSGANVRLEGDGSATLVSGAQDNGSGAAVGLTLLVAEQLGLRPERVAIVHQDTGAAPFDFGSLGSQTTFNAGRAALAAAVALRGQIVEEAAGELRVPAGAIELVDGEARVVDDPSRALSLATVAGDALAGGRLLMAQAAPPPPSRPPAPDAESSSGRTMFASFPFPAFYCCAARVAVDAETGRVLVLEVVACHDIGSVLNPVGAEGQVEGGVAHSVGMALSEGVVLDGGRQLTTRLMDYRLQTAADVPPVRVEFIDPRRSGDGPAGSRGVGEVGVIAAAGAVANAIADATGARMLQLPMLPDRVWATIHGREAT